jgi:hypothetical protein
LKTDFVTCLKLAEEVFEQYKDAHPKWWRRMDGTPILNDVSVLMAEKFNNHIYGLENCTELNTKLLLKRAADALEAFGNEFNRSPREQSLPSCPELIAQLRHAADLTIDRTDSVPKDQAAVQDCADRSGPYSNPID